ncbi:MAG: transposase [Clostridia bacterium]|nr:transposase [Clostridia bacterium]
MKLTFKYKLNKINVKQKEILSELMWHTTKVYNMVLYDIKEGKELINENKNLNIISTPIYRKYREENWHSKYLHSHTLQEVIINTVENYKSYKRLEKIYKEDKSKLKGEPHFPHFKNRNKQEIVYTKYGIRVRNNMLMLSLSKNMQEKYKSRSLNFLIPRKLKKLIDFESIKMIKIKEEKEAYEMEIIYEKEEREIKEEWKNILAIDLGLNNIVACTNRENNKSLLVDGKEIKSKNRYINNEIERLQQIQMKMEKNSKKYKNTKRINKLYEYRKNYIETYMHKVSKMVVEYARENKCKTIVIGDIKDIKEKMKNNRNFVQIPIQNLVKKIEYKAKMEGIKVEKISEKYTSGVSAIDEEEIVKENYNIKRRIYRGLFVTNKGKRINADVNGSLNILRKYIKSKTELEIVMNNGREQLPIKKRVA